MTLPPIQHQLDANFGNRVMLLGYDVEIKRTKPPGGIRRYPTSSSIAPPHPRIVLHLSYYWQCVQEMDSGYYITVSLEAWGDQTYKIDQSHYPAHGTYPTSLWREGDIVVEEYDLDMPLRYPATEYTLWIALWDWTQQQDVQVVNDVPKDRWDRVRAGVIQVPAIEAIRSQS